MSFQGNAKLRKRLRGEKRDEALLSTVDISRSHKASAAGILYPEDKRMPSVQAVGQNFYYSAWWPTRKLMFLMCKWAGDNKGSIPTYDIVESWCNESNQRYSYEEREENEILNVARLPEMATRRTRKAVDGGVIHECLHKVYTPQVFLYAAEVYPVIIKRWAQIEDWSLYSGFLLECNNIVEDIKIERLGCVRFGGITKKMEDLQDFILSMEADNRDEAVKLGVELPALSIAMSTFRDLGLGYKTQLQRDALAAYEKANEEAFKMVTEGVLAPILKEATPVPTNRAEIERYRNDILSSVRSAMDIIIALESMGMKPEPKQDKPKPEGKVKCQGCGAPSDRLRSHYHPTDDSLIIITCLDCGHQIEMPKPQQGGGAGTCPPGGVNIEIPPEGQQPPQKPQPQQGGQADDTIKWGGKPFKKPQGDSESSGDTGKESDSNSDSNSNKEDGDQGQQGNKETEFKANDQRSGKYDNKGRGAKSKGKSDSGSDDSGSAQGDSGAKGQGDSGQDQNGQGAQGSNDTDGDQNGQSGAGIGENDTDGDQAGSTGSAQGKEQGDEGQGKNGQGDEGEDSGNGASSQGDQKGAQGDANEQGDKTNGSQGEGQEGSTQGDGNDKQNGQGADSQQGDKTNGSQGDEDGNGELQNGASDTDNFETKQGVVNGVGDTSKGYQAGGEAGDANAEGYTIADQMKDELANGTSLKNSGMLDMNSAIEGQASKEEQKDLKGLQTGEKKWNPLTTEEDEIRWATGSKRASKQMLKEVRRECRYLLTKLRTVVQGMEETLFDDGVPKGKRLSNRNLVRTFLDVRDDEKPQRAYMNIDEVCAPSCAVSVIVDESGSMGGMIKEAGQCALAIAEPMSKLGAAVQVSGITSAYYVTTAINNPTAHRNYSVVYNMVKDYDEPMTASIERFSGLRAQGGTPLADGIEFAYRGIRQREEDKKIIFVITDGQPDRGHNPVMKYQRRLCKEEGIILIGVGIGSGATYVSSCFDESIHAYDIKDIPKKLVKILTDLITKKKMDKKGKRRR